MGFDSLDFSLELIVVILEFLIFVTGNVRTFIAGFRYHFSSRLAGRLRRWSFWFFPTGSCHFGGVRESTKIIYQCPTLLLRECAAIGGHRGSSLGYFPK